MNLRTVAALARKYPQAKLIAGGGIYSAADAQDYLDAGATDLSLGTVWFNPPRAWRLLRRITRGAAMRTLWAERDRKRRTA